jgi:hypothetical protein
MQGQAVSVVHIFDEAQIQLTISTHYCGSDFGVLISTQLERTGTSDSETNPHRSIERYSEAYTWQARRVNGETEDSDMGDNNPAARRVRERKRHKQGGNANTKEAKKKRLRRA